MERSDAMDYKKEIIIEMVNQIDDPDYIDKIYHYVLAKYRRNRKAEYGACRPNKGDSRKDG